MRYTFHNEYIFALLVNRKRHLNNTVCAKGYMIPLISLQPPNTSDPFKVITMILDTKLDLQFFCSVMRLLFRCGTLSLTAANLDKGIKT